MLKPQTSIADLFDKFIEASSMKDVLSIHHLILNHADLNPCQFNTFYPKLKRAVTRTHRNSKAKALFAKIDKKAAHKCYSNTKTASPLGKRINIIDKYNQESDISNLYDSNNALKSYNCLVIGAGPAGLRTAIELQLLGASRVVVVEKRTRFSRNNVLHLWPFVIDDLKSLGAKKFYGKFCAGSIDHISIRQLQLMLLKICLMIGCDFRDSCSYINLCPSSIKQVKIIKSSSDSNENDSSVTNKINSENVENVILKCDYQDDTLDEAHDGFVKVSNQDLDIESKSIEGETSHLSDIENSFTTSDSMKVHEGSLQIKDDAKTVSDENNDDDSKSSQQSGDEDKEAGDKAHQVEDTDPFYSDVEHEDEEFHRADYLKGARAHFESDYKMQEKELHSIEWDIMIGADGRRNTLNTYFPRKEFRGRLAIAITANFINRQTPAEAAVSEISGLSYIYNQDMFNALAYDTQIELENICYYKDDTHYFVMTAKKRSLLERGVLIKDYATTQDLLSESNVDRVALLNYAKDAAHWTTGLEPLDFALNHYGQEDCAMFDFTSMYAATNACKALRTRQGGLTLLGLVGDSLLEPFWPTGSGCGRGFLSSFDAAWMCRQWSVNRCAVLGYHGSDNLNFKTNRISKITKVTKPSTYDKMVLSVLSERESIYRILGQTTSENLHQNYSHWTLNPHTRYPNLNRHLVLPAQVEHLIKDNTERKITSNENKKLMSPKVARRVKSPHNGLHRRSPKKLKCTTLVMNKAVPGHDKTRPRMKSIARANQDFRSNLELTLDDVYYDFEASYNNLADDHRSSSGNYLNHRRPNCDIYDDYFVPSISGTLPSSNNLLSLEARRARDIDDCLRQRRQKNQLSAVRDKLIDNFKKDREQSSSVNQPSCGAVLFNELRKMREEHIKGKENRSGPLTLINSIRRCASFAERVRTFETKLSQPQTTPATPKVPIDNVKNLPEFATLQVLFDNNLSMNNNNDAKKAKIPIMKLSKNDWNVKCWEKRLEEYQKKNLSRESASSSKSLNRAYSIDTTNPSQHLTKPHKQVEVFKGRIKEMADKLKHTKEGGSQTINPKVRVANNFVSADRTNASHTINGGWVKHLRKELTKGVNVDSPQQVKNPIVPTKTIKKLFQDDDHDDDDKKHYDHLCVVRPTNKYLKNNYKSHLTRTKYNSATSKVINTEPSKESKLAYINASTSRGSSVSSTLSEYSTATAGSSSGPVVDNYSNKQEPQHKCLRCDKLVELSDKITIDSVLLHRACLTCSNCGITLRTNEIQHYINESKFENDQHKDVKFACSICKPELWEELRREAANKISDIEDSYDKDDSSPTNTGHSYPSRQEFLDQKINYNELYKNILNDNLG